MEVFDKLNSHYCRLFFDFSEILPDSVEPVYKFLIKLVESVANVKEFFFAGLTVTLDVYNLTAFLTIKVFLRLLGNLFPSVLSPVIWLLFFKQGLVLDF